MGSLQPFIEARRAKGVKNRTINYAIQTVRHILNLAAGEWFDEHGMTWLMTAPRIKLLPENDRRDPYPLNWEEQFRLFNELPRTSSQDGSVQSEHRMQRAGGLQPPVGVGNRDS